MSANRCPNCQAELAADAPQGLCPACLLEQAVLKPSATAGPAETSPHAGRFVPPTVDELSPRFPQLEIQDFLGSGGMGAVYKARQTMLDRVVALKILPPEINSDAAFAVRFTREAQALAKLTHPNIVTVFEFGESNGLYYLMMEFVDGVNLRESIETESLSPSTALTVISQICDALQYAHDEGVVHRDIKPENVLLDKRGRVKIADFGLAKLLGLSPIEVTLTATHQVMGTLHYMAPEQLERPLEVDHRADIYSLGVVFYELLTGELPLGRFKLPSEQRAMDQRLDDVVLKTLEREPKQRYQHVSEVKTDVDHISSSELVPPVAAPASVESSPPTLLNERLPTVPFAISKHGMRLADGVMRLEQTSIALEFEMSERATVHPFGAGFTAGLHEVEIRVDDISAIRLEGRWFSGTLVIQTDSVRKVTGIPSADRGRVTLDIASQDVETADTFVRGIGKWISGEATVVGKPDKSPSNSIFHPGRFGMGLVMVILGLTMFILGIVQDVQDYLWTGIGITLGGGVIGATGFMRLYEENEHRRIVGPRAELIVMAIVASVLGLTLLITGFAMDEEDFVWVGFGLVLGGGGLWCGAWKEEDPAEGEESERLSASLAEKAPPVKPKKHDVPTANEAGWDRSRLKLPAIGLCVTGAMDCCMAIAGIVVTAYVSDHPSSELAMPGALQVVVIWGGSLFGVGRIVGGVCMLSRRSYEWSILGAVCGAVPCGGAWLLAVPFGIWSLIVLNKPQARDGFRVAAQLREQAALEREEY